MRVAIISESRSSHIAAGIKIPIGLKGEDGKTVNPQVITKIGSSSVIDHGQWGARTREGNRGGLNLTITARFKRQKQKGPSQWMAL
jgi:hypothetical protein